MATINEVVSGIATIDNVLSDKITINVLPIELVWIIRNFLEPHDWLHFGLAYRRIHQIPTNALMISKYRSKFIEFIHDKTEFDDITNNYYWHEYRDIREGSFRVYSVNVRDRKLVSYREVTYKGGKRSGWKIVINNECKGFYLYSDDVVSIYIEIYRNMLEICDCLRNIKIECAVRLL